MESFEVAWITEGKLWGSNRGFVRRWAYPSFFAKDALSTRGEDKGDSTCLKVDVEGSYVKGEVMDVKR